MPDIRIKGYEAEFTYQNVPKIWLADPHQEIGELAEGETPNLIPYTYGEAVAHTVGLNFADGDMVVTPAEGELFSRVVIRKPDNLVEEKIRKGETIAGITGTYEGGSSGGIELQDYQNTSMTTIPSSAYAEVFGWKSAKFPRVTSIGPNAFRNCKNLVSLDFGAATSIGYAAFYYCSSLVTLILRASTMCVLSEINPALLFGLGVTNQCYIYVPSTLVSAYKTAECWGLFSEMFRAIEDYPDVCG